MSPKLILGVVIRLCVVWILFANVLLLIVHAENDISQSTSTILLILGLSICCLALWRFSYNIAAWLLRDASDKKLTETPPLSPDDWFFVGCRLLGIWSIGNGIPKFLSTIMRSAATSIFDKKFDFLFSGLFEIFFGLVLVFGINSIIKIIKWLRSAGHEK